MTSSFMVSCAFLSSSELLISRCSIAKTLSMWKCISWAWAPAEVDAGVGRVAGMSNAAFLPWAPDRPSKPGIDEAPAPDRPSRPGIDEAPAPDRPSKPWIDGAPAPDRPSRPGRPKPPLSEGSVSSAGFRSAFVPGFAVFYLRSSIYCRNYWYHGHDALA